MYFDLSSVHASPKLDDDGQEPIRPVRPLITELGHEVIPSEQALDPARTTEEHPPSRGLFVRPHQVSLCVAFHSCDLWTP